MLAAQHLFHDTE